MFLNQEQKKKLYMGQRESLNSCLSVSHHNFKLRLYSEDLAITWACCTEPFSTRVTLAFKSRIRMYL